MALGESGRLSSVSASLELFVPRPLIIWPPFCERPRINKKVRKLEIEFKRVLD